MKIVTKATQNHEKKDCEFMRKLIFAIPVLPKAWFSNPRNPDSDPNITRKEAWKQAWQNTFVLVQGTQKAFKMGSLNPPKKK